MSQQIPLSAKDSSFALFRPGLQGLCLLLLLKVLVSLLLILHSGIGLAPDEAQYWTWSGDLDWGYYSKPPAIAWQIFLGTRLFGDTELGVRFGSIVISTLLALSSFFLSRQCGLKSRTAFWSGVILSFSPLGILSAFAATTDGGFVLFWTLSAAVFARCCHNKSSPQYYLIGILIAIGALFKWPIYLLWIFILAFAWRIPSLRHKSLGPGMLISLSGLIPSIIWNAQNDWVTFRHVWYSVLQTPAGHVNVDRPLFHGNPLEFLAAQVGILSPISYFLLVAALIHFIKKRKELSLSLAFCASLCLAPLFFSHALSLFNRVQANWAAYAYPTGIVILSWYALEGSARMKRWLLPATLLSIILSSFVIAIPAIQEKGLLSATAIPYRANPFRHSLGWSQLQTELNDAGYNPKRHFLFSDKYQMTSILSFYNDAKMRAYFFNLQASRKNQFSFWPGMEEEQIGKTGFFVMAENSPHFEKGLEWHIDHYTTQLSPYFKKVQFLGAKVLFASYGLPAKGALIFKCKEYNGIYPESPDLY